MASQPSHRTTDGDTMPPALKLLTPDSSGEGVPPDSPVSRPRPWAIALAVAVVCGLLGAGVSWMLLPARHTATTRLRVLPQTIASDASGRPSEDPQAARTAELAEITSDAVLKGVLERSGIAELSVLAGQGDPLVWLRDNLSVRPVEGSNDVDIFLSGKNSRDLTKILYTLRDVYIDQAGQVDHDAALRQRWEFEQRYQPLAKEVQKRIENLCETLSDDQLRQGKVLRLGAAERILWAVSMAGNQEQVRAYRNLLTEFDRTTQTLQTALDASRQQSTSRKSKARPAKWMELMRDQAAQGIAPPAGTPSEEILAVLRQVDTERGDVQQEIEAAQDESDEAGRYLDALVSSSPQLQKRRADLDAYKRAMYQAEDQLAAAGSALAGPRATEVSAVTVLKTPVDDRRSLTILLRGLLASVVGFATVLGVDGLQRRIAAAT